MVTQKLALFDRLAEMIVNLELEPGSRLVEADLAAQFGVSKTPIREALLLLEAENLVETTPYHGASVTWLTLEEYREINFLLDALEVTALDTVIGQISEIDLIAAGKLVDRAARAREAEDSMSFSKINAQLHELLFSVARSKRLTRFVSGLVLRPGRRYALVFQHQFADAWDVELEVVRGRFEGIARRDAAAAAKAMKDGHAKLLALGSQRIDHPVVRPYLLPESVHRDAEVIAIKHRHRRRPRLHASVG